MEIKPYQTDVIKTMKSFYSDKDILSLRIHKVHAHDCNAINLYTFYKKQLRKSL